MALGAIPVTVNPLLTSGTTEHVLEDVRSRFVVVEEKQISRLHNSFIKSSYLQKGRIILQEIYPVNCEKEGLEDSKDVVKLSNLKSVVFSFDNYCIKKPLAMQYYIQHTFPRNEDGKLMRRKLIELIT